jgi:hypothetical protein
MSKVQIDNNSNLYPTERNGIDNILRFFGTSQLYNFIRAVSSFKRADFQHLPDFGILLIQAGLFCAMPLHIAL